MSHNSRSLKIFWGYCPPQPPRRKNFLHGASVLVHVYLHVRYDLPTSINFRDINGFPKLGPLTLIRGHPRGPEWYHWILRVWFPISHYLHSRPYLAPFPRYTRQHVQHSYIWLLLPLLHLTPDRGVLWDDLHTILHKGHRMARVQNSVETLWLDK